MGDKSECNGTGKQATALTQKIVPVLMKTKEKLCFGLQRWICRERSLAACLLIATRQSGPVTERFVLAEARKR